MNITLDQIRLKMLALWVERLKNSEKAGYSDLYVGFFYLKELGIITKELWENIMEYDHWLFVHIDSSNCSRIRMEALK